MVPNEMRGTFVSMYTLLTAIGTLVSNAMALLCGKNFILLLWVGEILCCLQLFGVIFVLPESPRWLGKNGMIDRANDCLKLIYKREYVEIYKRSLTKELNLMNATANLPILRQYKFLFTKFYRLIIIGCVLMMFQ